MSHKAYTLKPYCWRGSADTGWVVGRTAEGVTHALYERFSSKETLEQHMQHPARLKVAEELIIPYCNVCTQNVASFDRLSYRFHLAISHIFCCAVVASPYSWNNWPKCLCDYHLYLIMERFRRICWRDHVPTPHLCWWNWKRCMWGSAGIDKCRLWSRSGRCHWTHLRVWWCKFLWAS